MLRREFGFSPPPHPLVALTETFIFLSCTQRLRLNCTVSLCFWKLLARVSTPYVFHMLEQAFCFMSVLCCRLRGCANAPLVWQTMQLLGQIVNFMNFCFSCAVGCANSGFAASAPVFATACLCYSLYSLSCPHIPYTEQIFSCFSCLTDRIICKAWLHCTPALLFKSIKRIYKREDAVGTLRGCEGVLGHPGVGREAPAFRWPWDHLPSCSDLPSDQRDSLENVPSGGNWSGEAYTTAGSRNLMTMRGSSTTKG